MDDKRFQVFVSSTFLDLKAERQAVIAALLECDAFPAGMELFPAADDDAWTLIKRVIDDSDYYLLVIGGKYGSVDPNENISYTEKEFDYAVKSAKPVMAFLHAHPGSIPVDLSERSEERQAQLDAFRKKVQTTKHVKFWDGADSLAGQVALTYNRFIRSYPAVGWVRADALASAEALQALTEARNRVDALQASLDAARTEPPPGTEGLASGDAVFEFYIQINATYQAQYGRRSIYAHIKVAPSWDYILNVLGPRLLQDAEEAGLRETLADALVGDQYADARKAVAEAMVAKQSIPKETTGFSIESWDLDEENFGTIIVQLVALGLVEQSSRKRSVNDTGTYWTLTPYGNTRVIQLRALTADDDDPITDSPTPSEEQL